jgi:hypothetical protein
VPVPLDEFPVHQVPLSMAHVATGDRNFYDRSWFAGHDGTGALFFITGLGVYPNLGVTDAFTVVRRGDRQWSVKMSDGLGDDRLAPRVGPYAIDVVEPLHELHLRCDADAHGIGFDLTWIGSFPALDEPPHVIRAGRRVTIEAQRFAQTGTWNGVLRLEGEEIAIAPAGWVGMRDRSWGLRPVGEAEPSGRPASPPFEGFWWVYSQLRFDDYAIVLMAQEEADGHRVHNDAARVWADGRVEQLGWPEIEIRYRTGTRQPERATLHMRAGRKAVVVEVETLTNIALHVGGGYGSDPDGRHGEWHGPAWVMGKRYDLSDPEIAARIPLGVIDHACRAWCDGAEGWGVFEHGTVGRHDPSGFTDFAAVAP